MAAVLTRNDYGKSRIRLTRVTRAVGRHEVRELAVDVRLAGAFEASYTDGDNAAIVATDTMKNVVYALAQGRPAESIESFGAAIAAHFLGEYGHVDSAEVSISETPWRRIEVGGREHPHAFVGGGGESRLATIAADRGGPRIGAGIDGLEVLKTTGSGFVGFLRDRFTTLAEATDRIFATEVRARWSYSAGAAVDHDDAFRRVRAALLETFAGHESLAVQQTLHAMGAAALDACGAMEEIALEMPNKHRILADLGRFGLPNADEVFVATDEPFGLIRGTLRRA